jgi:hypothetical protein
LEQKAKEEQKEEAKLTKKGKELEKDNQTRRGTPFLFYNDVHLPVCSEDEGGSREET